MQEAGKDRHKRKRKKKEARNVYNEVHHNKEAVTAYPGKDYTGISVHWKGGPV